MFKQFVLVFFLILNKMLDSHEHLMLHSHFPELSEPFDRPCSEPILSKRSPLLTTPAWCLLSIFLPGSLIIRCVNNSLAGLAGPSVCGQSRGRRRTAPLMTFLLSLELRFIQEDSFSHDGKSF